MWGQDELSALKGTSMNVELVNACPLVDTELLILELLFDQFGIGFLNSAVDKLHGSEDLFPLASSVDAVVENVLEGGVHQVD